MMDKCDRLNIFKVVTTCAAEKTEDTQSASLHFALQFDNRRWVIEQKFRIGF